MKQMDVLCYLQKFELSQRIPVGSLAYPAKTWGRLRGFDELCLWWPKEIGETASLARLLHMT